MKDTFSRYHPLVNFLYFTFVFGFSMVFMHPICLAISLISAFIYSISLKGRENVKFNLLFLLPTILMTALINPLFNHQGGTILTYLPTGNPLTLESIAYGIGASTMLVALIYWFICFNELMTSDKFIYLFSRVLPSMSLVLSMSLRFVPKFKDQVKIVSQAQRGIGRDLSSGGLIKGARNGITILSIVVTWALENAIETADSMKSRGYGLPGRSSFSIYSFSRRDRKALAFIAFLGFYVLLGGSLGKFKWSYFPTLKAGVKFGIFQFTIWLSYIGLFLLPILINREEERQWKATQLRA